jgi:tetratricopeptide (TPR) repeat protein
MRARDSQADCEEKIAHLLGEAETSSDRSVRIDRLERAAEIYEAQIGDLDKAAAVWLAAFTEDFTHERSAHALERLAEKRGTGAALAAELRAQLPDATDPRQRAALSAWVGRWLALFTDDRAAGEAHLLEALRLDPGSAVAEKTLRALASEADAEPTPGQRPATAARHAPARPAASNPARAPAGGAPATPRSAGAPAMVTQTLPGPGADGTEAMHRRLDALVEASRWPEAVEVLEALATVEDAPMRARYLITAAKIVHHKVGNDAAAVALFNRALDAHPEDLAAFDRLYQILAGQRAWRDVEANLLRMIARIKADNALEKAATLEALWRRLGDVYRVSLEDPASAASAYEMCARLAPQDPRYPTMIAQLAERRRG